MMTNLGGSELLLILLVTLPLLLGLGWLVLTVVRLRARVEDLQRQLDRRGEARTSA